MERIEETDKLLSATQARTDGLFIIALSRAFRHIHRESEVLFRENDLTMTQFAVLEALMHKGDLTIGGLIAAVLSNSGNMTVVVRNLERQGRVCRRENPEDKRSYVIALTAEGRTLIEHVFPAHMQRVRKAISVLEQTEEENVLNILRKLG